MTKVAGLPGACPRDDLIGLPADRTGRQYDRRRERLVLPEPMHSRLGDAEVLGHVADLPEATMFIHVPHLPCRQGVTVTGPLTSRVPTCAQISHPSRVSAGQRPAERATANPFTWVRFPPRLHLVAGGHLLAVGAAGFLLQRRVPQHPDRHIDPEGWLRAVAGWTNGYLSARLAEGEES